MPQLPEYDDHKAASPQIQGLFKQPFSVLFQFLKAAPFYRQESSAACCLEPFGSCCPLWSWSSSTPPGVVLEVLSSVFEFCLGRWEFGCLGLSCLVSIAVIKR